MTLVFDTSTVIAVMRRETGADRIAELFAGGAMSSVNFAELVAQGVRRGVSAEDVTNDFTQLKLVVHAFDLEDATLTGALIAVTRPFGLSLGDRACLALAKRLNGTAVTANHAWAKLDLGIPIDVFR